MAVYNNDYTKQEDKILWEIHNIRHKLHNEWKDKTIEERNKQIKKLFLNKKKEWYNKNKTLLSK